MKKLLLLLIISVLFGSVTGCDDNEKTEGTPPYENPANAEEWYFRGTVEVDIEDGEKYTDEEEIVIKVVFDENGEYCNMVLYGANFHPGMPLRIDMLVNWVTVAKTAAGYSLTGNNIVPLYKGKPFPTYTVTDLTVNLTPTQMSLKMMCGDFPVEYNGIGYRPSESELDDLGSGFEFAPDVAFEGVFRVGLSDGSQLDNEETVVEVQFFEDRTKCTLAIYDVSFHPRMPLTVDLFVPGMKCTRDLDRIKVTGTGIMAIYEGVETDYEIKDFEGTITDDGFVFTMQVNDSPVAYSGSVVE